MTSNFRYGHIISGVNRTRLSNRANNISNITSGWINITLNICIRWTSSRYHSFLMSYHWINLFWRHTSCINGFTWLFNTTNSANCVSIIRNYLSNTSISILNSINSLFLGMLMTGNFFRGPVISRINRTRLSNRTTSTNNRWSCIISMTFNSCISRTSSRHHCFLMSYHRINLFTRQISSVNCTTWLFNPISITNCLWIVINNLVNYAISTCSFRNLSILTCYMTSHLRYGHIISSVNCTRLFNRTTNICNITSCWINITLNICISRTSSRHHRFLMSNHWINLFWRHISSINCLTWLFNTTDSTNCTSIINNRFRNTSISTCNSINSLFLCFFMTSNFFWSPVISRINCARLNNRTTGTINYWRNTISMILNCSISWTSSRHHCLLISNHWINLFTRQISCINRTTWLFNSISITNCLRIVINNFVNSSVSTSCFRNLSILTCYMISNLRYCPVISSVNCTRLSNWSTSLSNITSSRINITLNIRIGRTSSRYHSLLMSNHRINLIWC